MQSLKLKLMVCLIIPLWLFSDHCSATETKVIVLGDSLSAAYQMDSQDGWVSLLQSKLQGNNIQLINAAISGDTTDGGLARLPRLLDVHQPTHVYIELGGNDGLQGHNPSKIKRNIVSMIGLIRAGNAVAVLQQMRIPTNYGPRYNQLFTDLYQQIAKEHGVLLLPFFLDSIATDAELMKPDGIHPNEKAQPIIADFFYPHFTKLSRLPLSP